MFLRHRIFGEIGAELLVSTEQLTLSAAYLHSNLFRSSNLGNSLNLATITNAEDDDWIRPTLRARFVPENINSEP